MNFFSLSKWFYVTSLSYTGGFTTRQFIKAYIMFMYYTLKDYIRLKYYSYKYR